MLTVLEPTYFKDFHCIAGECKNTCCHEWNIFVPREEYMKIRAACEKNRMGDLFRETFKRCRGTASDKQYAEFVFNEKQECRFLREGLCSLQQKCGYGVLPETCKLFPRATWVSPVGIERACSTGCEEVINLLVDMPQGIGFTEVELNENEWSVSTDAPDLSKKALWSQYNEVQALCISILQNRDYSFANRMILLGLALQDLHEDNREQWIAQKSTLLQYDESMNQSLDALPINPSVSVANAMTIWRMIVTRADRGCTPERARRLGAQCRCETTKDSPIALLLDKAIDTLQVEFTSTRKDYNLRGISLTDDRDDSHSIAISAERYAQASAAFDKWMQGREYILENVMVNFFFSNQYPLVNEQVWDNYMKLCTVYNFFRVAAIASIYENPSVDALSAVWVQCSRSLMHSLGAMNGIAHDYHKNGADTLAHMAVIIKG